MTCERARHLIDLYAVDELSAADARALAAHVRTCVPCAAEMAGVTRLVGILTALPDVPATPDLDERILLAAFADRDVRHAKRTWWADLRYQLLRGTARTTGTFVATIIAVAVLGATFVFAASSFRLPFMGSPATIPAVQTPSATPVDTGVSSPSIQTVTEAPVDSVQPTPAPTQEPVVTRRPAATPEVVLPPTTQPTLVATPQPTPEVTPTPVATAEPTPQPTPQPSVTAEPSPTVIPAESPTPEPSPTEKPRRTPPPSASPTPTPSP